MTAAIPLRLEHYTYVVVVVVHPVQNYFSGLQRQNLNSRLRKRTDKENFRESSTRNFCKYNFVLQRALLLLAEVKCP